MIIIPNFVLFSQIAAESILKNEKPLPARGDHSSKFRSSKFKIYLKILKVRMILNPDIRGFHDPDSGYLELGSGLTDPDNLYEYCSLRKFQTSVIRLFLPVFVNYVYRRKMQHFLTVSMKHSTCLSLKILHLSEHLLSK